MIGLVVVTHGALAKELVASTEHVVGPMEGVRAVSIGPADSLEQRRNEVQAAVTAVDAGDGVVILTDMLGSTAGNIAVTQLAKGRVEVIGGANLPMLIRLAETRATMDVVQAAQTAREAGCRYIAVAASRQVNGDGK
jgi:PTS system mannose-specific IIA component